MIYKHTKSFQLTGCLIPSDTLSNTCKWHTYHRKGFHAGKGWKYEIKKTYNFSVILPHQTFFVVCLTLQKVNFHPIVPSSNLIEYQHWQLFSIYSLLYQIVAMSSGYISNMPCQMLHIEFNWKSNIIWGITPDIVLFKYVVRLVFLGSFKRKLLTILKIWGIV